MSRIRQPHARRFQTQASSLAGSSSPARDPLRTSRRAAMALMCTIAIGSGFVGEISQAATRRSAVSRVMRDSERGIGRPVQTASLMTAGFEQTTDSSSGTGSNALITLASSQSSSVSVRDQLIGTWRDYYRGRRTMTLRPDGKGTMLVELSGPAKILFAAQLRFDLAWELEGDQLTLRMLGGEPANKVAIVTKNFGDHTVQQVIDVTAGELVVEDLDDGDQYQWTRLNESL